MLASGPASAGQHPEPSDPALWQESATDLAAGIRCRELSAMEVVDAHLSRIEQVNPLTRAAMPPSAWSRTISPEGALAK